MVAASVVADIPHSKEDDGGAGVVVGGALVVVVTTNLLGAGVVVNTAVVELRGLSGPTNPPEHAWSWRPLMPLHSDVIFWVLGHWHSMQLGLPEENPSPEQRGAVA